MASFKVALLPIALVGAAGLVAAPPAGAQAFEILHAFERAPGIPWGGVAIGPDGFVYGTTEYGGRYDRGTVFRFEPAAGRLTVLHHFAGTDDGVCPEAGLVWGGDAFYGTTSGKSSTLQQPGTVFRITQEGMLRTLHVFAGSDGKNPRARLAVAADHLYGTTENGGDLGKGTVFSIETGISGVFKRVHSFSGGDGQSPVDGLTLAPDARLVGTTRSGGNENRGTIFAIDSADAFVPLHSFTVAEGASPAGGVFVEATGDIVGVTSGGGTSNSGTVYRYGTNGVLAVLYAFPARAYPDGGLVQGPDGLLYGLTSGDFSQPGALYRVNLAAASVVELLCPFEGVRYPRGPLVVDGNAVVGTTAGQAGYSDQGTLFRYDVGAGLAVLHRFATSEHGWMPLSVAVGDDEAVYGTTQSGGPNGGGTVFELAAAGVRTVYGFSPLEPPDSTSSTLSRIAWGGDDGLLYGVRRLESSTGGGSVFTLVPRTGERTLLPEFGGSARGYPVYAPTITSDGRLWGPAGGGANFHGMVYSMDLDGSHFAVARAFTGWDGDGPSSPLLEASDGFLYGTTIYGPTDFYGAVGCGTLFRASRAGGWLLPPFYVFPKNGLSGCAPVGRLAEGPGGVVYGATSSGGPLGGGVVYRLDLTSLIPTIVRPFARSADGSGPHDLVYAPDGFLYGAAYQGTHGKGLVFRLRPDGGEYAVVHEFDGEDGSAPAELVIGPDRQLYGVAQSEGPAGGGVVFRIALAPTASAGGPYTVDEGGSVELTATGTDPAGGTLTFEWDLDGDGVMDASGQSVEFVAGPQFDGPSTWPVAVRVTTGTGAFAEASTEVSVLNVKPVVSIQPSSSTTVDFGGETSFQFAFTDPGPDAWTATIDFGDSVTQTRQLESPGSFAVAHVYAAPGVYSVKVTVDDGDGGSGEARTTFTVRSAAQTIEGLITGVRGLVETGRLSPGRGNGLMAKLRAALAAVQGGDTSTAIEALTSFVSEAQAFKKVGILEPGDVDPLIAIAQAALAALTA